MRGEGSRVYQTEDNKRIGGEGRGKEENWGRLKNKTEGKVGGEVRRTGLGGSG